jgi:signal transduction histidine kinase
MKERQVVAAMIERIDALNDRVSDILLYAGTRRPRVQPVALQPLLAEVVSTAKAAAGPLCDGIDLSDQQASVVGDLNMLREVFLNLLMNACQASDGAAPITITIEALPDSCRVGVLDRGPGIPDDVRGRVFEPFFTTRRGGTGLGLAIVKRLLDRQGGSVSLEDRDGGGTAAIVTLPLARSSPNFSMR